MSAVRYIFYRFYQQQIKICRFRDEAAIAAILYMAVGPQMLFFIADWTVASILRVPPLAFVLGKWVYGISTYAISFWLHWMAFVRAGKAEEIRLFYADTHPYKVRSIVLAHLYFIVPAISAIIVLKRLSPL